MAASSNKQIGQHLTSGDPGAPKDVYSDDICMPMWELEAMSDGTYILKQEGVPVTDLQDQLVVYNSFEQPEQWVLRDGPEEDVYE
ncbi:hypothetical protein ABW21_db0208540 [Orbilia brochopaga]|nr:hypothetical protein ABW21_db0208540 [Drechslerella brochopaga]